MLPLNDFEINNSHKTELTQDVTVLKSYATKPSSKPGTSVTASN